MNAGDGFTWDSNDLEHDKALARQGWATAAAIVRSGEHQLVVLDELTYLMNWGWVDADDVVATLVGRPRHVSVIVTGRDASEALIAVGRHGHRDAQGEARVRRGHRRQARHRLLMAGRRDRADDVITFLVGGARSGKSTLAVQLGERHAACRRHRRVRRHHRALRRRPARPRGRHRRERPDWPTVEAPVELAAAIAATPADALVIVDCLTVWLGNLCHHLPDESARASCGRRVRGGAPRTDGADRRRVERGRTRPAPGHPTRPRVP